MSSTKYVPKHRAPGSSAKNARARVVRTTAVLSGAAVVATGISVASGVLAQQPAVSRASADLAATDAVPDAATADRLSERATHGVVTRSDRRAAAVPAKQAALSRVQGPVTTRTEDLSDADPRDIGRALLAEYGFDDSQFSCLDSLYVSESNWRVTADNPSSSAYGIPQALTATHDLPPDYMTSAESQIRWGLDYIASRYGTPCNAWGFKQGNGWY
ncbi:lytic transglycosylase domain-containing protein [Nocardioides sp. LHG3406-4]|uniref:aggregation-promoting factor C-terminal-like domain-containing protein n=1 Tax=Nocardioides sp. LHG3406-4 TaxID=2804575 RepID=UPI003CF9F0F5